MRSNVKKVDHDGNEAFTYRRVRKAIGVLGVSLPIVLVLLSFIPFFKTDLQPSISHYYYTNLRDLFTGTLCAVGLFLIRYRGHYNKSLWKNDSLLTNIAGMMAFGVAFIPTTTELITSEEALKIAPYRVHTLIPYTAEWLGWFHYGFAAVLFIIFSIMAINVFTIGQEKNEHIPVSVVNENNIYRFCGYSIIIFIVMVPLSAELKLFDHSTLAFEALSLFVFGFAWLIKGRALGDKGEFGKMLYREENTNAEGLEHIHFAGT